MNIINYHPKQPLVFSLGIVHCIKDTFVMILTEEKLGYLEMSYLWNISNIISLLDKSPKISASIPPSFDFQRPIETENDDIQSLFKYMIEEKG